MEICDIVSFSHISATCNFSTKWHVIEMNFLKHKYYTVYLVHKSIWFIQGAVINATGSLHSFKYNYTSSRPNIISHHFRALYSVAYVRYLEV